MKKLAFAFFVSLLLFSCEKDKQLIIENTDIPLISKVLIGGEIYMEYTYNDENLLTFNNGYKCYHLTEHFDTTLLVC